jgi:hypothetical protein
MPAPRSVRAGLRRLHRWSTGSRADVWHLIRGWQLDRYRLRAATVAYGPATAVIE